VAQFEFFPIAVILSEAASQAERRISRESPQTLRARSLAPLVKTRGIGITDQTEVSNRRSIHRTHGFVHSPRNMICGVKWAMEITTRK
jgi:hypothetical protein